MEAIFLKLLNMSIVAGWLVLVVMVLRVLLKKAPKSFLCFLWALVAFRLICPVSLESVLSLVPSAETIPEDIMYSREPEIHSGILTVNTAVNPLLSEHMTPTPGDSVNPLQVVLYMASGVWIVGMLGMALYAGVSLYRIRRQVAASLWLEEGVYLCDDIESPFILGIVKPGIYLPSTLQEENKAYVLAHERAHLKRRDHWWKPLGFALLTIYWFNPLMWVAYVLLCRDIELACDERVIRELGEGQKKSYSEALLDCSVFHKRIAACPLAFGEVGVKERVRTVLHYKKPAFWVILVVVLAGIVVAVCFLTNPKGSSDDTNPLGHSYFVKETPYVALRNLIYSVAYTLEDMPLYCFTSDMVMFQKEKRLIADTSGWSIEVNKDWQQLGTLQEIELTEDNFDNYFKSFDKVSDLGWQEGMTAKEFRKENKIAWEILTEGEFDYYLLQQKDNAVYLAVWDNASEGDYVRWLFRLERADMVSCYVETPGQNAFFTMDRYPDLPLEELYEDMPVAEVAEAGTLLFQVDGTPDTLQVLEEHYWLEEGEWCKEELGESIVTPNSQGQYALELSRSKQSEEYSVYTVLYQEGKYVMLVRYPDTTGGKGDSTENAESGQTSQDAGQGSDTAAQQNGQDIQIDETTQQEAAGQDEFGASEEISPLDLAIRKAVLGNEADNNIKGVLFNCASHVILGTETVCGVPLTDGGEAKEYVTVYAWVMDQSYVYEYPSGAIKQGLGGHGQAIFRFEVDENGEYILDEHLNIEGIVYARDRESAEEKYDSGSRSYKKLFQEMFPEEIREEASANESMYFYWLTWDCYDQAIQNAGVDTDIIIESLLDEALGNKYAWSQARELNYYGKYTLQYCFQEFLKGGQTDERGELMAETCKEIAKYYGEAELAEIKAANGQEWFEQVQLNAEELASRYDAETMAEQYPVSWLVLEMWGSKFVG